MAQTQGAAAGADAPAGAVRFAALVIRANAVLFAASAPVLLLAPGSMAAWLNIDGTSADVRWAVQVIGACLLGLAGQLWIVSKGAARVVLTATAVTFTAESVTTLLTALTPGSFTPMRWFFFGQGAVSALAYGSVLLLSRRRATAPHAAE
ncbi:MAG: hypothetical protein KGP01_05920 [Actinomycetales bacterium]|nr:hypothetical protein [Actinomycetales bacterium]